MGQPQEHRQTLQELASAVRCPVLMLPAGNDPESCKDGGEFMSWLPVGSSSHTYENMKHGYMSRAALDSSALAKMMGGSPEDITAAQADALQRTVDFFKAATEKPPVSAVPPVVVAVRRRSTRWAGIVILIALSAAVVAVRMRAKK